MTAEAHIPRKFLWPVVLIAIIGIILLAFLLEQMSTPIPAADILPPPTFSLPSGVYDHSFALKLDAPRMPNAQIIYTTNGRSPTPNSANIYDSPIPLNAAEPNVTIIRARTLLPDGSLSEESVGTYAMGVETGLPLVSLVADPEDIWGADRGILANPEMEGRAWERAANVTYLDENGRLGFSEPVGVRLHGQASRFYDKQSMRLYFRRDYGVGRLNYPLFPESPITSFDRLVLHSGGQDTSQYSANWTMMRTPLMMKLAQQIEAPTTNSQPVLLFLNGELHGVYHLRERPDVTFFQDHYNIDNAQIIDAPHREIEQPPAVDDWWALDAYAAENNMADPTHYATVLSQIEVDNLIDHYILQIYAANNDWPHNNEILFRDSDPLARWHWFLWDLDYSFGMMPSSNLEFDMVNWLMDEEATTAPGVLQPIVSGSTRFFRSLWDNPDFRNRFLIRAADLLNTTLSPENVSAQLNLVEADLENDIGYEIARWGRPGNWYDSAAEMHTFAEKRTGIVQQQFIDGFGLTGTAVLTLNPPAAGKGTVTLNNNGFSPELPFTGDYFLDTTITVTANPEQGYHLTGWEVNGQMVEEETTASTRSEQAVLHQPIIQDTTITPHFAKE